MRRCQDGWEQFEVINIDPAEVLTRLERGIASQIGKLSGDAATQSADFNIQSIKTETWAMEQDITSPRKGLAFLAHHPSASCMSFPHPRE